MCDFGANLGTYQCGNNELGVEIDLFTNPVRELVTVQFDNFSGQIKVNL